MKNFETELYENCPALAAFEHRNHLIDDKGKERLKQLREQPGGFGQAQPGGFGQAVGQAVGQAFGQPGQPQQGQPGQPQQGQAQPQAQPGQAQPSAVATQLMKTFQATYTNLNQMQQMLSSPEAQQDPKAQQMLQIITQAQQVLSALQ